MDVLLRGFSDEVLETSLFLLIEIVLVCMEQAICGWRHGQELGNACVFDETNLVVVAQAEESVNVARSHLRLFHLTGQQKPIENLELLLSGCLHPNGVPQT